jgi:heme/copper-type cytochrome/quinol oxidase subunit 4
MGVGLPMNSGESHNDEHSHYELTCSYIVFGWVIAAIYWVMKNGISLERIN